ncbi:MAG: high-affinity branched-chain amino acid transport ATP-binding proteinlivF protein [Actinomycetia bacterium]|nr:high-affinity branched-chain amino acid transport ATP-binding proteinlivF protein [Actinomycetes bacterium]
MSAPLLTCEGLEVAYGPVQILFGIDLEVAEGEVVALLGTNGAGKSTLLRAVSQLVDPIAGTITFDGNDVTHAGPAAVTSAGVVHVPGGKATFPTLSVAEHFRMGRWAVPDSRAADERQAEVLDLFPRLGERWEQLGGDLSGGEQQQLALGLAFVAQPRLLVIDELSLGLAPTVVGTLLEAVRRINAEGTTVLLVEQSVNVALTVAERAYFLEKGQVRYTGATAGLLGRDDLLRSVFLPSAGTPAAPRPASIDGPPALAVEGLRKRFGGAVAVDDVSFDVGAGASLGLLGPNGAGKTTVLDLVSGALPADAGTVAIGGRDVSRLPTHRRARLGLGRSFQDARLFPSLTVQECLAVGLDRHLEVRDQLSAALDLPAAREQEADVAFTVDELVELLGLGDHRTAAIGDLSTGTRRVVDLALAVAHRPAVLLLDEPGAGLAQKEAEALAPLLRRVQSETGCALVVVEHDVPLLTAVADELLALDQGRVLLRGRPDVVLADPRVVASYLGGDPATIRRSGRRARREPLRAAPA